MIHVITAPQGLILSRINRQHPTCWTSRADAEATAYKFAVKYPSHEAAEQGAQMTGGIAETIDDG